MASLASTTVGSVDAASNLPGYLRPTAAQEKRARLTKPYPLSPARSVKFASARSPKDAFFKQNTSPNAHESLVASKIDNVPSPLAEHPRTMTLPLRPKNHQTGNARNDGRPLTGVLRSAVPTRSKASMSPNVPELPGSDLPHLFVRPSDNLPPRRVLSQNENARPTRTLFDTKMSSDIYAASSSPRVNDVNSSSDPAPPNLERRETEPSDDEGFIVLHEPIAGARAEPLPSAELVASAEKAPSKDSAPSADPGASNNVEATGDPPQLANPDHVEDISKIPLESIAVADKVGVAHLKEAADRLTVPKTGLNHAEASKLVHDYQVALRDNSVVLAEIDGLRNDSARLYNHRYSLQEKLHQANRLIELLASREARALAAAQEAKELLQAAQNQFVDQIASAFRHIERLQGEIHWGFVNIKQHKDIQGSHQTLALQLVSSAAEVSSQKKRVEDLKEKLALTDLEVLNVKGENKQLYADLQEEKRKVLGVENSRDIYCGLVKDLRAEMRRKDETIEHCNPLDFRWQLTQEDGQVVEVRGLLALLQMHTDEKNDLKALQVREMARQTAEHEDAMRKVLAEHQESKTEKEAHFAETSKAKESYLEFVKSRNAQLVQENSMLCSTTAELEQEIDSLWNHLDIETLRMDDDEDDAQSMEALLECLTVTRQALIAKRGDDEEWPGVSM